MQISRRRCLRSCLALAVPVAGCFRGAGPKVLAGAKSGMANTLVAEAIALHLESSFGSDRVDLRTALGGSSVTHETLLAGQIELYTEFTGIALTNLLGLAALPDAGQVLEQVKSNYRLRFRCEWVAPLGFTNPPAITAMKEFAGANSIGDLSAAAAAKSSWRLGATREFMSRPDGMPLLLGQYKLPLSGAVQILDPDQLYPALKMGQVTLVAGETLDSGLRDSQFVQLADDRRIFPPQDAGVVVSMDALDRHPNLLSVLNGLSGRFTTARVVQAVDDWTAAIAEAAEQKEPTPPPARRFASALLGTAAANPAK